MAIKQPLTSFWLTSWAIVLAVGWLLPNHYRPWTTFHLDAWVALILSIASAAVFFRTSGPVVWHRLTLLTVAVVFIPGVQYMAGIVLFAGTAWVSSTYLIGFLLALLTGARWESASPGQLADGLFLAIGVAALISVGLQLHQWLGLDLLDIWSMRGTGGRPYANLGQPNQLGTLLLWGLLAIGWGVARQRIGAWSAVFMAAFLLFGLALTQSRTAWLGVLLLIAASWAWRRFADNKYLPHIVTGLGMYFAACVMSVGWVNQAVFISPSTVASDVIRLSSELRPAIWSLFLDAALRSPFSGYGWDQLALAQLAVSSEHGALHMFASQSHNLFLDLVLWCGIPLGLFISMGLVAWLVRRLLAVRQVEDAVLLLLVLIVGNHAMLELPLHHAYFLLPVGLVMGALNVRLGARQVMVSVRSSAVIIWFVAVTLLGLTIRDYSRVETSYEALRFEWAGVKTGPLSKPPEVLLLTQLGEFIKFARFEAKSGMTDEDVKWMTNVASLYPNTGTLYKLATAMALNQRPQDAAIWLERMCKTVPEEDCAAVKKVWESKSLSYPEIAAVPWPN